MKKEVEIIPITNDVMFKVLFTQNPDLLKDFLESTLDLPNNTIKSLRVVNSEKMPIYYGGKLTSLDILVETEERTINVEMQVARKEDFKERSLYYWARIYNNELKEGVNYKQTNRCICINILNFSMFDCPEYHSSFSVREDKRHELLTDKLQIHFLELTKIKRISESDKTDRENSLQLWLQLFKARSKGELDMLETTGTEAIKNGVKVIYSLSEDEKIREYVRQREKAEMDYRSDMSYAKAEGKAEIDSVLIAKWKAKGMTDEEIADLLAD